MSPLVIIILMVGIGAVIGGVTNSLAIKMLFRPYQAKFIGKFRVPFTPGLIPKRKEELAKQLGKMVVEHLITVEGIQTKLVDANFQKQVEKWLTNELDKVKNSEQTFRMLLKQVDLEINDIRIKQNVQSWLKSYQQEWMLNNGSIRMGELIDLEVQEKVEPYISKAATLIQGKASHYLSGQAAANKMQTLLDTYFTDKGFMGNMLASVLGGKTVIDKIQPLIVSYAKSDDMQEVIEKLLQKEWGNFLDKPAREVEEEIGKATIFSSIDYLVENYLPINEIVDKPINVWLKNFSPVFDQIITGLSRQLLLILHKRAGSLLDNFGLEQIVEEEVQAFPLERVEQLVLNISRKELKLITYLGALLGGSIGLFQGIFIVLVG